METQIALRGAKRVFVVTLIARIALIIAGAILLIVASRQLAFGYLLLRSVPPIVLLVLTLTPWLERFLRRAALGVLLFIDIASMSLSMAPVFFRNAVLVRGFLDLTPAEIEVWANSVLVEPFLLLLIPLVLLAWAYGRPGAIRGAVWASLLHVLTALWTLPYGALLARGYWVGQLLRLGWFFVIPLIVAWLARRERRYVTELERAHAKLQLYAETAENLAASHERNRLARELHDTLAHSLAALTVQLESIRTLQTHDPAAAQKASEEALALARQGLKESREAIRALRTDPLATLGLVEALRSLLEAFGTRTGVQITFAVAGEEEDLPGETTRALYRIAEEALANVERHAAAEQVGVRLAYGTDRIDLTIADDGEGFDPATVSEDRYGLAGMRERARMIDATLAVKSKPGGGTEVVCSLTR
jgi:signal transduction histidine kinase